MKRQITVADAIFGVGSLLTFLFSFFDFIGAGDFGISAWASGVFPLGTIPAVLGLLGIIVVVLDLTGAAKLPDQVLTLNWRQIRLTWGLTAAVIMLAYLIVDKGSGVNLKFGGWIMLIGSLLMAAGSIMAVLGKGTEMVNLGKPSGPVTPPPPPPAS
ncbi:MAG: hypothetical protein ABJD24_07490 [Acidimicrobiales bacterium]